MGLSEPRLISEIQRELVRSDCDLTSILKQCYLAAKKLELKDFSSWLEAEINGYYNCSLDEIPSYRHIGVSAKFFNPYHGWCPIIFQDEKMREVFGSLPIIQPAAELEYLLQKGDGTLSMQYPPAMETHLRQNMEMQFDIRAMVSRTSVFGILERVKGTLLNWSIELEAQGISGEDMSFSEEDKMEARPITQTIYAQNIGSVGTFGGKARIHSNQTTTVNIKLADVGELVSQIKNSLGSLPEDVHPQVAASLDEIQEELIGETDNSKLRDALASLRNICEGAAGNIVAQGIASFITRILGG